MVAVVSVSSAGSLLPAKCLRMRTNGAACLSYRRILQAFAKQLDVDVRDLYIRGEHVLRRPDSRLDDVATENQVFVLTKLHSYVIVLNRDLKRVDHVNRSVLPKLSAPQVTPAVDGSHADALHGALRQHRIRLAPEYARTCTVGQLGCTCSHLNVWRLVADSEQVAIVLEDDVVLCDDFEYRVQQVLAEASDVDWDWIYFFYHAECKQDLPIHGKHYVQRGFPTWGTVAYALTTAGAAKLIQAASEAAHEAPIDHIIMRLVREGELRTLCATELLVTTAGQINPLQPAACSSLGSNVWGTPKLLELSHNRA